MLKLRLLLFVSLDQVVGQSCFFAKSVPSYEICLILNQSSKRDLVVLHLVCQSQRKQDQRVQLEVTLGARIQSRLIPKKHGMYLDQKNWTMKWSNLVVPQNQSFWEGMEGLGTIIRQLWWRAAMLKGIIMQVAAQLLHCPQLCKMKKQQFVSEKENHSPKRSWR
jgi:hypothetical protein